MILLNLQHKQYKVKLKQYKKSSTALMKTLQKSIEKSILQNDECTTRNNQHHTNLVNPHQVDTSIVRTVCNLLDDKYKNQFSTEPVRGSSNLISINSTYPQQVLIKGSTMTYLSNGDIHFKESGSF